MDNSTAKIAAAIVLAIALTSVATAGAITIQNEKPAEKDYYERINDYASDIRKTIGNDFQPKLAVILGTGAGDFVSKMDVKYTVPYKSLNGFPVSTAPQHAGNYVFGTMYGIDMIVMQGRVHYYEGYDMTEVVLPLRVMHALGATTVIITNATGSLNPAYRPGTFMVANDLISSLIPSPLIGKNDERLGPRFTPMGGLYNTQINQMVKDVAASMTTAEHQVIVHDGVFIQVTGPQYETKAEAVLYHNWGADTVGMSSGCEAMAAQHMGMKICNINYITDMSDSTSSQEEVDNVEQHMAADLFNLIDGTIKKMSETGFQL